MPAPIVHTLTFDAATDARGPVAAGAYRHLRAALQSTQTRPGGEADYAVWASMASLIDKFAAIETPPTGPPPVDLHVGGYVGPLAATGGVVALTADEAARLWAAWDEYLPRLSLAQAREVLYVVDQRPSTGVA